MLHIVVSANTPTGSYPFTVRGDTQGTFKTSEDMVTVVVEASPKSREKSSDQQTNEPAKTTVTPPNRLRHDLPVPVNLRLRDVKPGET